jgi:hypothetical protein
MCSFSSSVTGHRLDDNLKCEANGVAADLQLLRLYFQGLSQYNFSEIEKEYQHDDHAEFPSQESSLLA